MKLAIALTHLEVVAALTAAVSQQFPDATIGEFTFAVDGDGQVTAHALADGIGAGNPTTEQADEKPARTGRASRGSRNAQAEPEETAPAVEEAPKSPRSRRGSTAQTTAPAEESEPEAPKTTRTRRGAKPAVEEAPAPTVPTKEEGTYTEDAEGVADEVDTYWASVEVPHDAFVVPAGQVLPSADEYDELGSEEEALERLASAPAEEVAEVKPTRTRRGAAKTTEPAVEETAPATTRKRLFPNRK